MKGLLTLVQEFTTVKKYMVLLTSLPVQIQYSMKGQKSSIEK